MNKFYHECNVKGEEEKLENARALLVEAAATVLEECLTLLGIAAPNRCERTLSSDFLR